MPDKLRNNKSRHHEPPRHDQAALTAATAEQADRRPVPAKKNKSQR